MTDKDPFDFDFFSERDFGDENDHLSASLPSLFPPFPSAWIAPQQDEKWDRRFLELARHISSWSKDPSTKVGAVIVDIDRIVVGMGYNGFPRGVRDDPDRYNDRETKYSLVVHAELNAVLAAGIQARGSTIYVYPSFGIPPLCTNCAKAVIQAGITRVVGYEPAVNSAVAERWRSEIETARLMCDEAGLRMTSHAEFA